MLTTDDPVQLTEQLVKLDTSAGDEDACAAPLARVLTRAGLEVSLIESGPRRSNLLARWRGGGNLVLSGHLDTVPFTASDWAQHPLSGSVVGDQIYGRGTSDMKGGLAAMTTAACRAAQETAPPFTLLFTIGEELGCRGAQDILERGYLPTKPIVIIGESTDNAVRFGHKGAAWLRLACTGRAAHGSRPELGVNAVTSLMRAIGKLMRLYEFPEHPHLGHPTVNLGTFTGGIQVNVVPDLARAELDFRTVPGVGMEEILNLAEKGGADVMVEEMLDLAPVWTDPLSALSQHLSHTVAAHRRGPASDELAVSYFTDGSVIAAMPGASVYICGPGHPDQPHTVNESCSVQRIYEAQTIYHRIIHEAPQLSERATQDLPGEGL